MTIQTIILLVLVGLAAGILSGMVGVGGGIIIVPCLVFLLGYTQKESQGNSLALLLLPLGILGVMNYYKEGFVDFKVVIAMAVGFVLGNYFGSKWALTLNDEKLKKFFAVVLLLGAIKLLFFDKPKPKPLNKEIPSTTLNRQTGKNL